MRDTILWQRAEGAAVFAGALALLPLMPGAEWAWWVLILVFFAPDLSFAAYLGGPRLGAGVYNLVHSYGAAVVLIAVALWAGAAGLLTLGVLALAHAGLDRALGYGLKSSEGFTITHLGRIGKDA